MGKDIAGWMILHYGLPYLRTAVASMYDQCDRIIILYTDSPSQGFGTKLPCPDSEDELWNEVSPFWKKVEWIKGRWSNEGEHTNAVYDFVKDYKYTFRFDADEIVPPGMVAAMIKQSEHSDAAIFQVPFQHFWRSFDWVCRDSQAPVRLVRVGMGSNKQKILNSEDGLWRVHHFGYAQPTRYIAYKLEVSGHHTEFKVGWLETKWKDNSKVDLHPVCNDFWNAQPFDKHDLPVLLKMHPYFNVSLIE